MKKRKKEGEKKGRRFAAWIFYVVKAIIISQKTELATVNF